MAREGKRTKKPPVSDGPVRRTALVTKEVRGERAEWFGADRKTMVQLWRAERHRETCGRNVEP